MGKRYTNWIGTTKVPLRRCANYKRKWVDIVVRLNNIIILFSRTAYLGEIMKNNRFKIIRSNYSWKKKRIKLYASIFIWFYRFFCDFYFRFGTGKANSRDWKDNSTDKCPGVGFISWTTRIILWEHYLSILKSMVKVNM